MRAQEGTRVKQLEAAVKGWNQGTRNPAHHDFRLRSFETNTFGETVSRFDHFYQGVRIAGADGIAILDAQGKVQRLEYAFGPVLEPSDADVMSNIPADQARKLAGAKAGWVVPLSKSVEPMSELVLEPVFDMVPKRKALAQAGEKAAAWNSHASFYARRLTGFNLVHTIQVAEASGAGTETVRVDAHSGQVLSRNANACSSPGTPITLKTRWSGTQAATADPVVSQFSLEDAGRKFQVFNGNNSALPVYNASGSFGDNQKLAFPGTTANSETAAADAYYGVQGSFDFYYTLFGRPGWDASNSYRLPVYVHANLSPGVPAEARWSSDLFGTAYSIAFSNYQDVATDLRDPTEFGVVAHEYTHLVNFKNSKVGADSNSGIEQKAINEASSTILSTAMKAWVKNGRGTTTGATSDLMNDWVYQPQVNRDGKPGSWTATQYLFRPSLWVGDPSWWTSNHVGWHTVHAAGEILHRMFYFLAQGGEAMEDPTLRGDPSNPQTNPRNRTSPWTPMAFPGVGLDAATRIYYRAFTTQFTSSMNFDYVANRLWLSANELYGANSLQAEAVGRAASAVNLWAPSGHWFTWSAGNATRAQAAIAPTVEMAGTGGTLSTGTSEGWVRINILPYCTLSVAVDVADGPTSLSVAQAPRIEIRDGNGTTPLANSGDPSIFFNVEGGYYDPECRCRIPLTSTYGSFASAELLNATAIPKTVYLRVYSSASRTKAIPFSIGTRNRV